MFGSLFLLWAFFNISDGNTKYCLTKMIALQMKTFSFTNAREWRTNVHCVFVVSLTLQLKDKGFFFSLKGFSPPLRHSGDSNLLMFTNRKLPSWKITQQLYGSVGPGLYISSPHATSRRVMHFLAYAFSELEPVSVRRKVTSRVWPFSRAGPIEATFVLAGQKKVEEAKHCKPFLYQVISS